MYSLGLLFVAQVHHAFSQGLEVLLEVLVELNSIEVLNLKDNLFILYGIYYPMVEIVVVVSPPLLAFLPITLLTLPNLQNICLLINSFIFYHRLHIYRNHFLGDVNFSNRH